MKIGRFSGHKIVRPHCIYVYIQYEGMPCHRVIYIVTPPNLQTPCYTLLKFRHHPAGQSDASVVVSPAGADLKAATAFATSSLATPCNRSRSA